MHLSSSPIVIRDGWKQDWGEVLVRLDDELGPASTAAGRRRSHHADAQSRPHEVNLGWHPKAEDALWRPELQQAKRSHTGMWNVRYRNDVKREGVSAVPHLIAAYAPWLRVRYAF